MPALKKSPFFEFLNRRDDPSFGAFMATAIEDEDYIEWNSYVLPFDFGDAEAEYHALRKSCAVCDVTPMCKIRIRGADAGAFLDHLVTRPVSQLAPMRATYTVYCNEDGTLKDDSVLYKISDDDYMMMPSDIDHSAYFETLRETLGFGDVTFEECSGDWDGIAIQGPQSAAVMQHMGFDGIEDLTPFQVRDYDRPGGTLRVARMGFTADLGYELWCKPELAGTVMDLIGTARQALNLEIPGYALRVIDTCRMEGGFVVAAWDFATDLDPEPGLERTPFEVGLGWLVNLEALNFPGRDALRERKNQGHRFAFRTFSIDEEHALDERAEIFDGPGKDDASVGIVTSSSWSWGLLSTLGNASILAEHAHLEMAWVAVGDRRIEMSLKRGPFLVLDRRNEVPANIGQDSST